MRCHHLSGSNHAGARQGLFGRSGHRCLSAPAPSSGAVRRRQRCPARVQAAAASSSVSQKYLDWAAAAGIRTSSVEQAQFGELRGARATADIPADEPFITVPRSAALVVTPQQRCPYDFIDGEFWKGAPWYVKMAVLLLVERQRGQASPVWGYIQQLPESIDTPVRWADADLAQLQYPPLIEDVRQQQRQWRGHFEGLRAALRQGAPAVGWDDFLWAAENVRSRAFSGPYTGATFKEKLTIGGVVLVGGSAYVALAHLPLQQALNGLLAALMFNIMYDVLLSQKLKWHAMCPVIDMMNHSSAVESEVAYEYFQDAFALSTATSYAAGQQVFISYGKQSNSSLVQYYGFVEANNPNDVYVMEVPAGGRSFKVTINAKGGVEADGQDALREAVGAAGEGAVWQAVAQACEQELARLPTSLADDERSLKTPHLLSPRARLALELRLEKKRLLQRGAAKAGKRAKKQAAAAKA